MRNPTTWCLLAAALLATDSLAADAGYSFVEGRLLIPIWSHSGRTTEGSGFAIHGSTGLGSRLFGFAEGDMVKYDWNSQTLRLRNGSLGLGVHLPIGPAHEFTGTASYEHVRLEDEDIDRVSTEKGWGLGIGFRVWTTERAQFSLDCRYQDAGDLASAMRYAFGGRYYVSPAFATGMELSVRKRDKNEEDMTEAIIAVTLRYDFGKRR
jgi:hypothetical protein